LFLSSSFLDKSFFLSVNNLSTFFKVSATVSGASASPPPISAPASASPPPI
jgi:hypothetical protein